MLRAVGVEVWDRVRLLVRIHVSGSKVRVSGLVGLKLKIFIGICVLQSVYRLGHSAPFARILVQSRPPTPKPSSESGSSRDFGGSA